MNSRLDAGQIEDLILYCGSSITYWKDDNMQICCPVHGESNPSMGVSEELQKCHCFSCDFSGTFDQLLINSLPDEFGYDTSNKDSARKTWWRATEKAKQFLEERYEVSFKDVDSVRFRHIKRYEENLISHAIDAEESKIEIPMYKIAPFMSGKETYKYFFNRGFSKQDVIDFKIGRDLENKTVTIPVFNEDGTLAGVIGRYISKNRKHNERYKIYDNFSRGELLYPLNKFEPFNDTIIGVEGQFDAITMHKHGFTNTLARMTNNLTEIQADWISNHCSTYIDFGDNDERGIQAMIKNRKKLKNRVRYLIVDYPDHGKDPCDWTFDEIDKMLAEAHSPILNRIRRM